MVWRIASEAEIMQQEQTLTQRAAVNDRQPSPAERQDTAGRDKELQLSRRVDWRFLLPDPRLRHLAYLGPKSGLLIQALRHFGEPFSVISWSDLPDYRPEIHPGFDLVIVHSPRAVDLQGIQAILKPGGYLYWEIERAKFGRRWRLRHFSSYVDPLASLNFDDIRVNWHRPNFDSCLEIIPLDDHDALRYVFARSKGNLSGQLQVAAGKFLTENDLLSRVVSSFSLVARKAPMDGSAR